MSSSIHSSISEEFKKLLGVRLSDEKKRHVRFLEQAEESKQRQEEIREEVKLARYLNQSIQVDQEQGQESPVQV